MRFDEPLLPAQEEIMISEFQCFQRNIAGACQIALDAIRKVEGKYDEATKAATKFIPLMGSLSGLNSIMKDLMIKQLERIRDNVMKFYILEKTDDPRVYKFYMPSTDSDVTTFKAAGQRLNLQPYTPIKLMGEIREIVFPRMGVSHFIMACEQADMDPDKEG